MKKIIAAAGTAMALTFSTAVLAENLAPDSDAPTFAKRDGKQGKRGHRGMHRGKLKRIIKYLDSIGVDKATQSKIKAEAKANKPEMKKLHQAMKDAKQTGDPLIIGEARLKIMEKRLEILNNVRKYLSDAQWTQVSAKMKEARHHKRARRMQRRQQLPD